MDLGRLELDHGNFAKAEQYLKKSQEICLEFRAKGFLQRLKKFLGDAALGMKNFNQAQEHYQESLQLGSMVFSKFLDK